MAEDWTITLERDEALVIADYLFRFEQAGNVLPPLEEGEKVALWALMCCLEKADDGTCFASDYKEQVAAARERLRLRFVEPE